MFEDALGDSKPVDAEFIVELLSKMTLTLQCAVLNACFTAKLADGLSAHRLYVIGCDSSIDDEAAVMFSRVFYQALSAGHTYRESFDLAVTDLKINAPAGEAKKYIFRSLGG